MEAIITNPADMNKPLADGRVSKRRVSMDKTKEKIAISSKRGYLRSAQTGKKVSQGEWETLQDFTASIQNVCDGAGIAFDLLGWQRVDFKFDAAREVQPDSLWVKQCNLLIAAFDAMWKCAARNRDFRQAGQCGAYKGASVKRGRFEIVHYDKDAQKHGYGIPFRLEMRCHDLQGQGIEHGLFALKNLLQRVKGYYRSALDRLNDRLVQQYESTKACVNTKGKLKVNTFLLLHRDAIYSRQQLLALYERLGDCNSKKALDQYYELTKREARLFITESEFYAFIDSLSEGINRYLFTPKIGGKSEYWKNPLVACDIKV
ncbi:MAG: hypothetical protein VB104_06740 [Candidatus Limiplasma sp.]|nr:hypothetical protein [Candidatus Limiplasma sp.]